LVHLSFFNRSIWYLRGRVWWRPFRQTRSWDYDGDGITDLAIYRTTTGAWFIYPSSTGPSGIYGVGFGGDESDKPIPADYDGDTKTDIAVYRATTGPGLSILLQQVFQVSMELVMVEMQRISLSQGIMTEIGRQISGSIVQISVPGLSILLPAAHRVFMA